AMSGKNVRSWVGLLDQTLTADEIHAGEVSDDPETLLPEATTLAIPSDRRLSILGFIGSLSQGAADKSPPRLMFAAAIRRCDATVATRSRPDMMSDSYAERHGVAPSGHCVASMIWENTWTAINCAPLATPENGTPPVAPFPAAMPATWVP